MSVIILTIDGGGIRGVIPAKILTQLEQDLGAPMHEVVDILGGTSTGGIIALGLSTPNPSNNGSTPFTASQMLGFYMNDEASIFVKQSGLDVAEYYSDNGSGQGIQPWLQQTIGSTITLSQAASQVKSLNSNKLSQAFTTSYLLNQDSVNGNDNNPSDFVYGGPYLFNWSDAKSSTLDDYYVWEAARGTSAAPTYFPFAMVGGGGGNSSATLRWVVDGGMVANNPMLFGISEAFRLNLASSLADITVISLGTGLYLGASGVNYSSFSDGGNWGTAAWLGEKTSDTDDLDGHATHPLTNVLSLSNQISPSLILNNIMPDQFLRLEPSISFADSALDGTDTTGLEKIAADFIGEGGAGNETYNSILDALGGN
ncbi:MAG: patatin-like phospholipase family protein [Nitrospina sp.]|jgi:hypothetical protein|nr:patatin-like phospholipase family protein [Nitrospina sp.]MBT6718315.1 patatin-like phospholipase family protein [Nitrospina sp.]